MPAIRSSARVPQLALYLSFVALVPGVAAEWSDAPVEFVTGDGRVAVVIDGQPIAVYCYHDRQILHPYFAHVRTADGIQVTRNHPPAKGHDLSDHDTMHAGIWLAYGDLSGSDFWRNVGRIQHAGFVVSPRGGPGRGTFTVRNEYIDPKAPARIVCQDTSHYTFVPLRDGYLILFDVRFTSDRELTFGDQEEMGLGIRMATPLRVGQSGRENVPAGNGTITNSAGEKNEKSVWGHAADWCDFTGTIAGRKVGATILCHPANTRPTRFHARDYGMLTANPFGQKCFGDTSATAVVVHPGEEMRLRYGVYIHSGREGASAEPALAYQDYLRLAEE